MTQLWVRSHQHWCILLSSYDELRLYNVCDLLIHLVPSVNKYFRPYRMEIWWCIRRALLIRLSGRQVQMEREQPRINFLSWWVRLVKMLGILQWDPSTFINQTDITEHALNKIKWKLRYSSSSRILSKYKTTQYSSGAPQSHIVLYTVYNPAPHITISHFMYFTTTFYLIDWFLPQLATTNAPHP